MKYLKGKKEYFKGINKIPFEGKKSKNPLAFKWYEPDRKVGKKTMAEHLRFAACYLLLSLFLKWGCLTIASMILT